MDLKDLLKQIGDRTKHKDSIATEEATKNAFVMPFLQALGYDVFNPLEVVPEFVADLGLKKGEKIDYAIFKDGTPTILIECKHWGQNLDVHDGQLMRYFHVSKAKFGLLTNGISYRFYSDLAEANKMDEKPFLEFTITDIRDNQIDEIKKFHKSHFDVDNIVNSASELKYTNELKALIQQEINNPSSDFVKLFAKQVYTGVVTSKILEQFTVLTKRSFQQHISDLINERLKTALMSGEEKAVSETSPVKEVVEIEDSSKIISTEEELEAYMIVKTILRQKFDKDRIVYRDAQSYFSIILDNNNRKPITRLYFNASKKYISLFDENKKETKIGIESLDDIFNYSNELIAIVENYDKQKEL